MARLSDEAETMLSMQLAGGSSLAQRAGRRYVKTRGYGGGCLAILGFEGERADVLRRRAQAARILRSAGALSLGTRPGRAWERGRYDGPYLRDALLDNCIMVETLETATQWSGLMDLYAAVGGAIRKALESRGTPPLVMCHVSHLYPNGASLYFTFFAAQEQGNELEQWRAAKSAACDAIVGVGGTITHHHAIGTDHAPWMDERGRRARRRAAPLREAASRSGGDHEPGQAAASGGEGAHERATRRDPAARGDDGSDRSAPRSSRSATTSSAGASPSPTACASHTGSCTAARWPRWPSR